MARTAAAHQLAHYERAGPGLLADTPLDAPNDNEKTADWWPATYAHSEARLNQMRAWRFSWWSYWRELARLYLPYRYHWVITPNSMNRGRPVNDAIINSTGTLAMRICAAGMYTGLMSPSRPWFRFGLQLGGDELDAPGKRWLDDASDRVMAVLAGSNFYRTGAQLYQDTATFGTGPMLIYEDEEDIIRCYGPCAGEYMLASSARNTTDTIYREFTFTVAQIIEWFGTNNCPPDIQEAWRAGGSRLEREYVVAHAIEPNFAILNRSGERKTVSPVPRQFTYREVYWLRGRQDAGPLSIRGFYERPFIAILWSQTSNDPYGRSPGMDAYGDNAQLQHMEVRGAEYVDKFVRPPMVGDKSLAMQPSSIRSGDITFVDATDGKQQFYPAFEVDPAGFAPLDKKMERVEQRIDRAFYVDVFLAISQMEGVQPRETLELQLRQSEKIQMLGPVIESAEGELSAAIYRVTSIMQRRGMFQPMPQSLKGRPIKIVYQSIMKLMQKAAETAGMSATVKFAGEMTEAAQAAQLPSPMRVLKLDDYVRDYADIVGNPAKLVYSQAEVAQMDAAAAHAKQQAAALQATLPMTQAAKNVGDIDIGGGQNAIAAMLGGGQQQPQQGAGA